MNVLALFAGIGGIELGLERHGFRTICYVERDPYAAAILAKNMAEGRLSSAPVWDDVKTFDGTRWRGVVDVISGGFPCQDISSAGYKEGLNGKRSGLWSEFRRITSEIRPRYVVVENVSAITHRGINTVLGQLSEIGYNAIWFNLQAREVGAPHRRERLFIIGKLPNTLCRNVERTYSKKISSWSGWSEQWKTESKLDRVVNGLPREVDRLRCLGNAVVPQCAYEVGKVILWLEQNSKTLKII